MATVELHAHIVALEKRRRLYSAATVAMLAAALAAGYRQADSMNSGGFVSGLDTLYDYPGAIVDEAWPGGLHGSPSRDRR
jgi:phosphonate transport system permease protein